MRPTDRSRPHPLLLALVAAAVMGAVLAWGERPAPAGGCGDLAQVRGCAPGAAPGAGPQRALDAAVGDEVTGAAGRDLDEPEPCARGFGAAPDAGHDHCLGTAGRT